MNILVLNCGSSSVKFKLFDMLKGGVVAQGLVERIGMPSSKFRYRSGQKDELVFERPMHGHSEAVEVILHTLTDSECGVICDVREIHSVGHRVVHGGESFQQAVVVNGEVLSALERCSRLAPLHNPPNIKGIQICRDLIPHAVQVAVFDTAFHQTMPDYAYMYAIPYKYYKTHGVRKYGFHGTSHKYVAFRAADMLGANIENLKIVTCHLGNGSSLCAVRGGKSLDTTMGFTPLAGVVMGTRCGDVDPAIVSFIAEMEAMSLRAINEMLNKKSGVLGISDVSSDFRDLEQSAAAGEHRARLALEIFCYSVSKGIGSLIPSLEGLDALVFTAGIGENSPDIRRQICSRLEYLGVLLDVQRNSCRGKEMQISTPDSRVRVLVIPTDEEKMIAEETRIVAAKE